MFESLVSSSFGWVCSFKSIGGFSILVNDRALLCSMRAWFNLLFFLLRQAATDDAEEMQAKAERAAREHENSKRSDRLRPGRRDGTRRGARGCSRDASTHGLWPLNALARRRVSDNRFAALSPPPPLIPGAEKT